MPRARKKRSIIHIFTMWFFALALLPTLLAIYATAKYLALQTVSWANRYLTQLAVDESKVISLSLESLVREDGFTFAIEKGAIRAVKNGLTKTIAPGQLATSLPVEAKFAQIFAPKLFFGFGYQPRLEITEFPTICLEDSRGNTLFLEKKTEKRPSPTSDLLIKLLIKIFGLKKSLEVEAPVPKTNLKVRILMSAEEILRKPLQQIYIPLGGEIFLVALLASILYPFAASQIAYPLRALAKKLSEFEPAKKENMLEKSTYTTSELAEIASSFEAMAKRIRETLCELEKKVKEVEEKNALLSKAHQQLKWLASNDPLTGVLNRRSFMEQCLAQLATEGPPYVGVLMIDVDNFKFINDTFGHPAGDSVLRSVGEVLKKCVRKNDLIGRYGGDEFVLFFPIEQAEEFHQLAKRIFTNLNSELAVAVEPVSHISISIGGAIAHRSVVQNLRDFEHLISYADQFLLQSKRQGKNTLTIKVV